MKRRSLTLLLLSTLCLQAQQFDLEALKMIALKNNPNIKISKANSQEKEALIKESRSTYLPQVNANANLSDYEIKTAGVTLEDSDVKTHGLTVSQLLFDFGQSFNAVDASKQSYEAALKEELQTISESLFAVESAYYKILSAKQLIRVAQESVQIDKLQLEQSQAYLDAGIRTKIDVTNSQLQLSNSNLRLIQARYDLKTAQANLISLLGVSKSIEISSQEEDILNASRFVKALNTDLDHLINKALQNRAEIMVFKHAIQAQQNTISSQRADYLPSLQLQANYSDTQSETIATLDQEQVIFGVYLNWNLFSGFRTDATIQRSQASLSSLQEQQHLQELSISESVTNAYFDVKELEETIKVALRQLALSQESLDLAQERYKNGLNDIVELNDAKLSYTQARTDLVTTYYNYKIALANLSYEIGEIYQQ